jgi:hypothetical protein
MDEQTGCSDDASDRGPRGCWTREMGTDVGKGDHQELTAAVTFHDDASLFESSRESTADATDILAAWSIDRFAHVRPTRDVLSAWCPYNIGRTNSAKPHLRQVGHS